MTDVWRLTSASPEMMRGAARYFPHAEQCEVRFGDVVGDATFECASCRQPAGSSNAQQNARTSVEPPRLHIQARGGVGIQYRVRDNEQQPWRVVPRDDLMAIGSSGGHADRRYTWIQIVSSDPETIHERNGTERLERIDPAASTPDVPESGFEWRGREWFVDAGDRDSARYADDGISMPTDRAPNHEIIYDRPTAFTSVIGWMDRHREVDRVTHIDHFETYLYELPRAGAADFLPRLQPIMRVLWARHDFFVRRNSSAPAERSHARYDVWFIEPNPIVPPPMISAMWRGFHGR